MNKSSGKGNDHYKQILQLTSSKAWCLEAKPVYLEQPTDQYCYSLLDPTATFHQSISEIQKSILCILILLSENFYEKINDHCLQ